MFAKTHGLNIKYVLSNDDTIINSGPLLNGLSSIEAKQAVIDQLKQCERGHDHTVFRLRDWLVSRQVRLIYIYYEFSIKVIYPICCRDIGVHQFQ